MILMMPKISLSAEADRQFISVERSDGDFTKRLASKKGK